MTLYSLDLFSLFIYSAVIGSLQLEWGVYAMVIYHHTFTTSVIRSLLLAKAQPKAHAMPCYASFDSGTNTRTLMHMQAHLPGLGGWTARNAPARTM